MNARGRRTWGWTLGRTIAPPRFVLFALVLLATLAPAIWWLGRGLGVMLAFCLAALVFLVAVAPVLRRSEAAAMRAAAVANDANRPMLLGITGVIMVVILIAVGGELEKRTDRWSLALVVATLVLAWLFSNAVYAFHYAHLFYLEGDDGKDVGGLDVPGTTTPDYWDFLYFSFTLGMTFQTSDVTVQSGAMRKVVLGQSLAAFVFNLGVLAFTINVIGG